MGDTSGIFHILYIYYRTYVGVCVTPFFFFFGVRCAQYKVHAQCSFAALAPLMPCMLLVIYYYRTYVGVCVTPFFFFFGVRCAQYKVHAQCSFAALAPLMPCMLLVIYYYRTYVRVCVTPFFFSSACAVRSTKFMHSALSLRSPHTCPACF